MHGLVNRAFENFLKDRHGIDLWQRVVRRAGLPVPSFEPLSTYDLKWTEAVIDAAVKELDRPRDTILEDMGTALVSSHSGQRLRRLLRFGGVSFRDFLHSLEEMPARAHLALPDLHLPNLKLDETSPGRFRLQARVPFAGAGCILSGLLRALADDYGALVLLDMTQSVTLDEVIVIDLLDEAHAEGRRFDLSASEV